MRAERVLWVGDPDRAEFAAAIHYLERQGGLWLEPDLARALQNPERLLQVTRIFLAPSFRGEFREREIDRLTAICPLAEITMVVGSWCEGETRSGRPWPGISRWYVSQLVPRLEAERTRLLARHEPAVTWRPATLTADEHWLLDVPKDDRPQTGPNARSSAGPRTGLIVVCAETDDSLGYLSDVCQAAGWATLCHPPDNIAWASHPTAVLYDVVADRSRAERDLRRLTERQLPSPCVALVSFPRPDEIAQFSAWGAHRVLGKPFLNDDLYTCLAEAAVAIADVPRP
jgi:hypothetical protein